MQVELPDREERREFLEDRQKGVGGSDLPALAGAYQSRDGDGELWKDVLDVYHEKTRPIRDEELVEPNLIRGIVHEPVLSYLYMEWSGNRVRRTPTREHPEFPFMRVNTDRIIESDESRPSPQEGTGALEVKSPHSRSYDKILEFGIPDYYIIQVQWEMFVHGYEWGEIVVGGLEHRRGPLLYHAMEAHPLLQEQLAELAREFWMEHVRTRTPPDPVDWHGRTWVEVPEIDGDRKVWDDEEARFLAHRVMRFYELRKEAKDRYSDAKDDFKSFMEARDEKTTKILVPGQGKVNYGWREGQSRIDTDKLEDARLLDYDAVFRAVQDRYGLSDEEVRSMLNGLEADLDLYMKHYDAYRAFRPYPADNLLHPSENPNELEESTDG